MSTSSLVHEGVQLVMTNQFNAARAFCLAHADDPRVALLSSLMAYLNAISSHAEDDLTDGLNSVWATEAHARKHLLSSPNVADSIEGELIQADCHMLGSMIQFIQGSYLKVAWNIRKAYAGYHRAEDRITEAEDDGDIEANKLAELKGPALTHSLDACPPHRHLHPPSAPPHRCLSPTHSMGPPCLCYSQSAPTQPMTNDVSMNEHCSGSPVLCSDRCPCAGSGDV
jgi:hypothetical protein